MFRLARPRTRKLVLVKSANFHSRGPAAPRLRRWNVTALCITVLARSITNGISCKNLCGYYVGGSVKEDQSDLMGRTFESDEAFLVTAERIANFCASVGEDNPLYLDAIAAQNGPHGGIVAPPAFVASFRYADNVFQQVPAF